MFIIILMFLSSTFSNCENKKLLFINEKDIEEIKQKEAILSNTDTKLLKNFIKTYPYSTFSYYVLEKANYFDKDEKYRKLILNRYKINGNYKLKENNKFLIINRLKKKFYSTLDEKLSLKIGQMYSENKRYDEAELFYLFSNPNKEELKDIYEEEKLLLKLSLKNEEIKDLVIKLKNKRELLKEAYYSFKDKKFDIAKAYYKKSLIDSKFLSENDYKEIFLKLGEIAFFQNNYKESLSYLGKLEKISTIEEKIICIYYSALCYYKTKEYKKALKYFENIKKFYPFTIWERKASIYIDKIKSEV